MTSRIVRVPVSLGEIIDKLTILQLKADRLPSKKARSNAQHEAEMLMNTWSEQDFPTVTTLPEWEALRNVNDALWTVEEAIRDHEQRETFDEAFISLARSVYRLNDQRAALKRSINARLNSEIREEKSYETSNLNILDEASQRPTG